MPDYQRALKYPILTGSFWPELLFAWAILLLSISLATSICAATLALGFSELGSVLVAAIPMSILVGGAFLVRQAHRRCIARRLATSPWAEIEDLLQALDRISSDDRRRAICRVLEQCNAPEESATNEQEHRIRLFGLYLLGCSVFLVTALNVSYQILEYSLANPLLDVALIISTGIVVHMLLHAIRSLRMRRAELKLKRLLGLT